MRDPNELVTDALALIGRLLKAAPGDDISAMHEEGAALLRAFEQNMAAYAMAHPEQAYPGTRAWYLLDEMFKHATLLASSEPDWERSAR